jgi:two-component system, NarL family, sensor histidine kinase DesK
MGAVRLSPRDFRAGRILMLGFLVVLLSRDLVNLYYGPPEPARLVLSLLLAGVVCASYAWFWLRIAGAGDPGSATAALAVLTAGVVAYTVIDPSRSYPFYYPFYYCAMVAGAAYPWRLGLLATAAMTGLGAAVVAWAGGRGAVQVDLVIVMLLLGLAAVAVRRHVASFVQLRLAREEVRRLAVSEERLRVARDLHDQLGQSLSTVYLQSEALALELPADADPRVVRRAAAVADTARAALDEMRRVAAGYRGPDLRAELEHARQVLEACGVRCHVDTVDLDGVGRQDAAALAWAVREATTNVLRHSAARNCWIELSIEAGEALLVVRDDGRGASRTDRGTGLAGVRERVEALGGRVTTETAPSRGFRLDVQFGLGT